MIMADRVHSPPRLYSEWGAALAAVTGGILPGMLLLGFNFRDWGEDERARRAIRTGILGFLVMVGFAMLIPYDAPWGRPVFQSIQVAFVLAYFIRFQKDRIHAHRAAGGSMKSNWRAAGIGIAYGLAFTALTYGTFYLIDELT
jgi:hypothetical protein